MKTKNKNGIWFKIYLYCLLPLIAISRIIGLVISGYASDQKFNLIDARLIIELGLIILVLGLMKYKDKVAFEANMLLNMFLLVSSLFTYFYALNFPAYTNNPIDGINISSPLSIGITILFTSFNLMYFYDRRKLFYRSGDKVPWLLKADQ